VVVTKLFDYKILRSFANLLKFVLCYESKSQFVQFQLVALWLYNSQTADTILSLRGGGALSSVLTSIF
jgi:hypothetical protein